MMPKQPENLPIAQVVDEVWDAVVGTPLTTSPPIGPSGRQELAATVAYLGDWRGAIVMRLDAALARLVGSRMFMLPAEALSETEIHDAVGEVCNMIGGNLRAHLSTTCELGTPTIVTGVDLEVAIPDTTALVSLQYRSGEAAVGFTLLQHAAA